MKKWWIAASIALISHPAWAATYYVSAAGSDSNAGTARALPWATLQHAADSMAPGDVAVVTAGKYNERVYVTNSGTASQPITFEADPGALVQTRGFEVLGANYIQVIGFDITGTSHTSGDNEHMYGILWSGANGLIQGNYIHDICAEGIMMGWTGNLNDPAVSSNQIVNNRIARAEMAGAEIEGQNNVAMGNDIDSTLQYPAGCPARSGADADGFRAFGSGHLIVRNTIHGIPYGTSANSAPHSDCLQTWGPLSNTVFDSNLCYFPAIGGTSSSAAGNEAGNIDNSSGAVTGLWITNNTFYTMRQGMSVTNAGGTALSGFEFINNTIDNVAQEALITKGLSNALIENNIFYNVGTGFGGGDSYFADDGTSTYVLSANDFWVTSGSPGTWPHNYAHLQVNPVFIDAAAHQYALKTTSTLLGQGLTAPTVTHDADGTPRPAGGYDPGAFQH